MFRLLYDPVSEIRHAKKQGYAKLLLYLVAVSLFATAGVLFLAARYFPSALTLNLLVSGIVGLLFGLIAAHIVVAFFFSFALHILDGKGGYYDGLTALVYAMVAPAIMLFFGGALTFIPFGPILFLFLLVYGVVLGTATLFRAAKEFFELDYAGVLSAVLITFVPLIFLCTTLFNL